MGGFCSDIGDGYQTEWHDARSMDNTLRYLKSIFSVFLGGGGRGSYVVCSVCMVKSGVENIAEARMG